MSNKVKISKGLLYFAATILIISGIISILGLDEFTTRKILDKLIFFLSGGLLIVITRNWKGTETENQEKK